MYVKTNKSYPTPLYVNMKLNRIALCTVSNLSKLFFVYSKPFSSECFYRNKKTSKIVLKSQRLYSFMLKEDIFLQKFNNKMTYSKMQDHTLLSRKRFTDKMRFYGFRGLSEGLSKYHRIVLLQINDSIHRIYLEKITLLLYLKLGQLTNARTPCTQMNKLEKSSSFHLSFILFEKHWQNSDFLRIQIPSCLHPEILVRIFAIYIEDVTLINIMSYTLHTISIILTNPSFWEKNPIVKFITKVIWNLWIEEFHQFYSQNLVELFQKSNVLYPSNWSFLRKLSLNIDDSISSDNSRINTRFYSYPANQALLSIKAYNYIQYSNNCIISLNAKTYFLQLLKYSTRIYWKYRMGLVLEEPYHISLINFNQKEYIFLGVALKLKDFFTKVQTTKSNGLELPTHLVKGELPILLVPIVLFTRLLCKYGFCTSNGYPISKPSWSTWLDIKIIERFHKIFLSISYHYSGCMNLKALSQIKYILSYSCAKTLACKHKTNLRSIWYMYSNQLMEKNLLWNKSIPITYSDFSGNNLKEKVFRRSRLIAVWNLEKTNPDPIVSNLINKTYI